MININPVKNINKYLGISKIRNISFYGSSNDTFERSEATVKFIPRDGNNMIRLNFEKDFLSDKHFRHKNEWTIKEERAGNNHIFTAYNPKNRTPQEIRVYGKKGKIIKMPECVAKDCKFSTKPDAEGLYTSQEISVKRKDGTIAKAVLKYQWIESENKMFYSGLKFI